ncbi:prephenate dehydratase [Alicyclobacillus sacchari]|uniref:prephenate dehydratase n=1 Tax=Alicyclobacillus sacchari TaxID=392010 RepID=A0A4R8LSI1_9BACL|nr:prephenate dehydratase domain-containing protein [Alicyclobacillus sacchari]TDY50514.1 prephenate dehydratase [Alicyclobacillus sacchari]GMA59050.1 prephenate dehydratase [Alicyclobacillus sacchari]
MRLYYLGPEGTHSHEASALAAKQLLPQPVELLPLPTFTDVLAACFASPPGEAFACVPIENSIQGSVWQVWDEVMRACSAEPSPSPSVWGILAAVTQPIHQFAVFRQGADPHQVTTVLSHPQALAQCAHTLKERYPNALPTTVSSTAEAVRQVAAQTSKSMIAIGSRRAAEVYGLAYDPVPLEDHQGNVTRFAVIGPREARLSQPADLVFTDETASLCLRGVPHRPGGLVSALQSFAGANLNLTRLESRPVGDKLGHYVYYLDVSVAGLQDEGWSSLQSVVQDLATHGTEVISLGVYPVFRNPG